MKLIFSCMEIIEIIIDMIKSTISTFLSKCKLLKRNLASHEFYQFPKLLELDKKKSKSNDDLQVCCAHLKAIKRDMSERF